MNDFAKEVAERLANVPSDARLLQASANFMEYSIASKYSYNFSWLGRPIIQYPQDMVAFQELVWKVRPDVIVETGIAHGGSLILSASLLALLDLSEAAQSGEVLDPTKPKRRVIGVDIDIRPHNREAIEAHPMAGRITLVQGSSTEPAIVEQVRVGVGKAQTVMVCLDSNHTHDHVLAELEVYAPMVSIGSYCVVFDTIIEDLPEEMFTDRPWGHGDNAKTAVRHFLAADNRFAVDKEMENKLLLTVAPNGYLKRIG